MQALLNFAFRLAVRQGDLTVVRANGERLKFGDGTGTPATVRFKDAKAEREIVFDAGLKLGELFTDGRITVEEGSLYDFLSLMLKDMRDLDPPWPFSWLEAGEMLLWRLLPKNKPDQSRSNVAHHYDLGDALYELFLDPDWQYSCAYFERGDESLAEAQLAKKRHIAAKLLLTPQSSVLDIGCGWGGLALYLARVAGVRSVLGITLSEDQIARAKARATLAQFDDRVEFQLADYRAVQGQFDRIVSVGMFEHVGIGFYDTFFQTSRRLLRDDGVMLLHTIGLTGNAGPTNPWILKYIFPGGHLPALSDIVLSVQQSGLLVTDVETLGPHYAQTLRAWRMNFIARRDEAAKLYDERFCRMWEFYLTMAEVAFRTNDISLYQLQIARDRYRVPLTRDYLPAAEQTLRKLESQQAE